MTESPGEGYAEKEGGNEAVYHRKPRIALPAEIGIDTEYKADNDAIDAVAM